MIKKYTVIKEYENYKLQDVKRIRPDHTERMSSCEVNEPVLNWFKQT